MSLPPDLVLPIALRATQGRARPGVPTCRHFLVDGTVAGYPLTCSLCGRHFRAYRQFQSR